MIPWEIHAEFLDKVVYAAIVEVEDESNLVSKNYTVAEWQWKASMKAQFSGRGKNVIIAPDRFHKMQIVMRRIIKANPESLGRFGSFFFVLEAKGIKQTTNYIVGSNEPNPYTLLKDSHPEIDFEVLKKRENGQLLMDLGLTFHPMPLEEQKVVSLGPREDCRVLRSGWMRKPTLHKLNTMSRYGGCQAEMTQDMASLIQK